MVSTLSILSQNYINVILTLFNVMTDHRSHNWSGNPMTVKKNGRSVRDVTRRFLKSIFEAQSVLAVRHYNPSR